MLPGLQGGPLMHVIAAKAVAFGEALRPAFKLYARNVVENAKALAETLKSKGLDIVSGGTDTHLMLVIRGPGGSPERSRSWRSAAPTSPATRTASRSTRRSRRSRRASGWGRRPAPPAASASPNSRRSAT